MKRKLLGLLGILTLISGCSNVNQRSIDLEVTNESVAKKINYEKRLADKEMEYTYNNNISYKLISESDNLFIQFQKKEMDGFADWTPYEYSEDENGKVTLIKDLTKKQNLLDFLGKDINVIYVKFISSESFDFNKVKYVEDKVEVSSPGEPWEEQYKYRIFEYDLSGYEAYFGTNFKWQYSVQYSIYLPYLNEYDMNESFETSKNKANQYFGNNFDQKFSNDLFQVTNKSIFRLDILPKEFIHEVNEPEPVEEEAEPKEIVSRVYNKSLYINDNFRFSDILESSLVNSLFSREDLDLNDYYLNEIKSINYVRIDTNTLKYTIRFDYKSFKSDVTSEEFELVFNKVLKQTSLFEAKVNVNEIQKIGYSNDILKLKEFINLKYDLEENQELTIMLGNKDITNLSGKTIKEVLSENNISRNENLKYILTQSFGNKSISNIIERVTLNIFDDIKPELFGDLTSLRVKDINSVNVNNYLEAMDDSDGKIKDFKLEKDEEGYYILVEDKSGNKTIKRINVDINEVYDDVIVLNENIFELDSSKLYSSSLLTKILNHIHCKEISNLDLTEYVSNPKKVGDLKVKYILGEEAKEITLRIKDKGNVEETDKVEKKENQFVLFFQKLGNWFKGVFTKWKFDCFITNEEWDIRFN